VRENFKTQGRRLPEDYSWKGTGKWQGTQYPGKPGKGEEKFLTVYQKKGRSIVVKNPIRRTLGRVRYSLNQKGHTSSGRGEVTDDLLRVGKTPAGRRESKQREESRRSDRASAVIPSTTAFERVRALACSSTLKKQGIVV